ncbi:MAG TPA: tetratricopeptide repeat protein [bacterium]|nr:tetratricopeptide repeat protein [bacterium]HPN31423.1 tetratricopeptide repeat protein [bacterium]
MKTLRLNILLTLLFFVCSISITADDSVNPADELEIRGIRNPEPVVIPAPGNLSEIINKFDVKQQPSPRNLHIKIIEKDTSSLPIIFPGAETGQVSSKEPEFMNLGDVYDFPFYLDTSVNMYYEPNSQNQKISINDYKRFFEYICNLVSNKLYSQTINEIAEIQSRQLFSGEREKLNFIKIFCLLELNNNNEAALLLNDLKANDSSNKYREYILFFQAKYFENMNQPDDALKEYLKIYNLEPDKKNADDALYKSAELLIKKNEYKKALEYLEIIVNKYSQTDFADDALFLKAKLYDNVKEIKDYSQAELNYRKLYKTYPKSKFAEDSQKRGAEIRNNFL